MRLIALAVGVVVGFMLTSPIAADDQQTDQQMSLQEIELRLKLMRLELRLVELAKVDGQAPFCMVHRPLPLRGAICAYSDLDSCEAMIDVYRKACTGPATCVRPVGGHCMDYESVLRGMNERAVEIQRLQNEIQRLERLKLQRFN